MKKFTGALAVAFFALTAALTPASAGLIIMLDDGLGNTATFTDEGAGDLNTGVLNNLIVSTTVGAWSVTFAGTSSDTPDASALNSFSLGATGGTGSLTATISQTFTNLYPNPASPACGITPTIAESVDFKCLHNDVVYDSVTGLTSGGSFFGAGSVVPTSGSEKLTQIITINSSDPKANTIFDATSTLTVPEPAALGFMGLGLLGLGLARRRKKA